MDALDIVYRFRVQMVALLIGLLCVGASVILLTGTSNSPPGIEIVEEKSDNAGQKKALVVEVAGSVNSPGVYKLEEGKRVEDALAMAGGVSSGASQEYLDKIINRAAHLIDGQKIYIPSQDEQSEVLSATNVAGDKTISSGVSGVLEDKVNVNMSSKGELEELWGIGPVTAQNIIDHRPYSTVGELLEKGILKQNVYERNKDILSVY
ncbi:hypothetical protein C4564_04610 [Candidatus Microgenomates bacterium]|nr:MAG: hypothetical protein C4564_04610 [Candidatus Microgenomates bacterium]